jgi:hypothetical protein
LGQRLLWSIQFNNNSSGKKKKKGARQADARAAGQELSQSERGIDFKYGTGSKDEKR